MSIIKIFICECCGIEMRNYRNEMNDITLSIKADRDYADAYDEYEDLGKVKVICNGCADSLNKTITKFFKELEK